MSRPQAGFTLVEVLLSVGLLAMLVGLSASVYGAFQNRNDLDLTTQQVVRLLRRAEIYARAVRGDSQWGVAVQSDSVVLYKGASYSARDSTADEVVQLSGPISASGLSEVNFAKLSAVPSTSGTLTLTSTAAASSRVVTLNSEGMVGY